MPKQLRIRSARRAARQESLDSFFSVHVSNKRNKTSDTTTTSIIINESSSQQAEQLGARLQTRPVYLTTNKASWYIHVKNWMPSSTTCGSRLLSLFDKEWNLHPTQKHPLKLFGRTVYENRWSQAWGVSYPYSGSKNVSRPIEESTMVPTLLKKANELTEGIFYEQGKETSAAPFNGCLQNWYEPQHTIGLHADDEKAMRQPQFPIFSLSWGGTRRFLLRSKQDSSTTTGDDNKLLELWLHDGDLLVMGGTCQLTHRHEVPKLRKTMDPPTSNRINWTIRAFVIDT